MDRFYHSHLDIKKNNQFYLSNEKQLINNVITMILILHTSVSS